MKIVLQKYIADAGFCSRRQAEEYIKKRKVKVNKKTAELGMRVDENDRVTIDGRKIELKNNKIYIILNKPAGYTCTNRKFKDEKNIFELVDVKERLYSVGRLDKQSRGLVLLTNDGELTEKLTHPRFGHKKEYLVQLKIKEIINNFKKGVDIGDGDGVVKAKEVKYLGGDKFKIILTEGKKRQIRRMFKALSLEVVDLKRVRIGNVELGKLKEGEWRYLKKDEIMKI